MLRCYMLSGRYIQQEAVRSSAGNPSRNPRQRPPSAYTPARPARAFARLRGLKTRPECPRNHRRFGGEFAPTGVSYLPRALPAPGCANSR
eukprot:5008-Prorocentrum_minimum.AAC.3